MYKKTITYTDYNGTERSEDFYFNLSEVELTDMNYSFEGGFVSAIKKLVDAKDTKALIDVLKDIINRSYGIKSDDGRRFIKKPEYLEEFMETPAYGVLYLELASNETAAAEFIKKVVPSNLSAQVDKATVEKLMADNKPTTI